MELETIYEWTAKRAGGAITISGKTAEGNPRKVTNVQFITLEFDRLRARDAEGRNYRLAAKSWGNA